MQENPLSHADDRTGHDQRHKEKGAIEVVGPCVGSVKRDEGGTVDDTTHRTHRDPSQQEEPIPAMYSGDQRVGRPIHRTCFS